MQVHLLGIMSGTSADGADVALVRWAPGARPVYLGLAHFPMPEELQTLVLSLQAPGVDEVERLGEAHARLGAFFAEAAKSAMRKFGISPEDIAAIGLHGQTIRHRPRARHPFTLQIGMAATLAEQTGCTVVFDFRSRDIAAGGEGAPLAPWAHRIWFGSDEDIAVLNLGGVANITFLGAGGTTLGFDCGPANAPLDALVLALTDGRMRMDEDGELAAQGHVDAALLEALLAHPFLQRPPPKSADKHEFLGEWLDRLLAAPELSDADRLATACAWIARAVAAARRWLPRAPARWLVCGGGVRNRTLMQYLKEALAPAPVMPTDAAGLPAEAVEAASFALLAWQALLGAPNTVPAVTGARHAVTGGAIVPGARWAHTLETVQAWIRSRTP